MQDKKHVLLKIFISTLYLSAFTFGGGYVIVTLMKKKFVDEYHWIDEDEMLDLVAIAQSAPGAIAVNGAIVVGYKLAGLIGAAVSIVGTILPPFLIISVISLFYTAFRDNLLVSQMLEGMQSGVGAVIAIIVYEMAGGILHEHNCLSNVILTPVYSHKNEVRPVAAAFSPAISSALSLHTADQYPLPDLPLHRSHNLRNGTNSHRYPDDPPNKASRVHFSYISPESESGHLPAADLSLIILLLQEKAVVPVPLSYGPPASFFLLSDMDSTKQPGNPSRPLSW